AARHLGQTEADHNVDFCVRSPALYRVSAIERRRGEGIMKLPLMGGCQCRGIRYAIHAEPLTLYACHCTECRKQSGSAFALSLVVSRSGIRIVQGSPREWIRRHESGRLSSCLFCGDCGTRLYHNPHANEQVTILKPGTLDDTS